MAMQQAAGPAAARPEQDRNVMSHRNDERDAGCARHGTDEHRTRAGLEPSARRGCAVTAYLTGGGPNGRILRPNVDSMMSPAACHQASTAKTSTTQPPAFVRFALLAPALRPAACRLSAIVMRRKMRARFSTGALACQQLDVAYRQAACDIQLLGEGRAYRDGSRKTLPDRAAAWPPAYAMAR